MLPFHAHSRQITSFASLAASEKLALLQAIPSQLRFPVPHQNQ